MSNTQAAGYHGAANGKYVVVGETVGTPVSIPYITAVSLAPILSTTDQYANNRLVLQIPKDNGYDGELGTTAPDPGLEKALRYLMDGEDGKIKADMVTYKRVNLYYEMLMEYENQATQVRKVWLYNVQIGKGEENSSTDAESVEFGTYAYPIQVYGTPLLSAEDTEYIDENGMRRMAYMIYSDPGDSNYATFGNAVPEAVLKTQTGG